MIEFYKDDISTIISIVPFAIHETKPGLFPGNFKIPACLNETVPSLLYVGASEHLMHVADRKQPQRLVTPSFVVADSIVRDFLDGQLSTTPEAIPGITYVQGKVTVVEFCTKQKERLDQMKKSQRAWFVNLVKETDNDWNKFHNTRVVSDQARFAAKTLGLEPEWLSTEIIGFENVKCPACGTANDKRNAVCGTCRCILDETKYKSLKFA